MGQMTHPTVSKYWRK